MSLFSFLTGSTSSSELPEIFPFPSIENDFISTDVETLYSRILTDTFERTQGIPDEKQALLWDNCLASESPEGLITMLAKAMSEKKELFLVYNEALKVVVKAKPDQEKQIKLDYEKGGQSKAGVYITFKKYNKTDMVRLYSRMEYCTIGSLWKSMNISKAVQLKFTDMRASTSLADKAQVQAQALALAEGLRDGKDVAIDAKDIIETAKPDLTATNSAEDFINQKLSKYTGMPAAWITGKSKGSSLGDTGQSDAKAVERGLKPYYFSIVKPVVDQLFDIKSTFESEDFDQLTSSLEALKTFDITSDENLSKENKTKVINRLFGLPENTKGDKPEKVEPPVVVVPPGAPPPKDPKPAAV